VIGKKFYAFQPSDFYGNLLKNISRENLRLGNKPDLMITTANICRVGKDLFWDTPSKNKTDTNSIADEWIDQGFRVHVSHRGYHSDAVFCVVKPGCIVSLNDVQNYEEEFPGWDVLYLPDQGWDKISPFVKMKQKVGGRWWLEGEEQNDQLIEFVNTWLNDWVGYVEETVFDVNMLSIDQNTIICNNYNKAVFEHFKKHKVEPIIFNFRHRYFWDGGVHCITQDLYREGKQEDYFA
jgi:glycine amidinotransferase